MPFQSVPFCVEAVIQMTIDTQPGNNVLGYRKLSGYTQTDVDNLATSLDTFCGSDLIPLLNVASHYDSVLVRGLENIIDFTSSAATSAGVGTAGSHPISNNIAFVVTRRTPLAGRSARGRLYMGGLDDSHLATANSVTTTYANAAVAYVNALDAAAVALGWEAVIISRFSLGAKRLVAIATPGVVNSARNVFIDSMRRRLVRGH